MSLRRTCLTQLSEMDYPSVTLNFYGGWRMKDSIVPQIEAVREQFEKWRGTRTNRREAIPGELWRAAVELCGVHPISNVSPLLAAILS